MIGVRIMLILILFEFLSKSKISYV
ncbi:hypothetical protein EMEDMD4_90117 [Sinorhizobium medicae]|uniref:Uncharacterized protein n=1 Tax=Sinorhizobium medicae TaxID=110321 RepID=A0A508X993_9HYPH|nr:hypothetical protein EMEDMD4_90117 [Sinorhizobium medicae]